VQPCVLLRVGNLTRWLVALAVRNAHPSSPNSRSSMSRDLLPLVAFSHVATRTLLRRLRARNWSLLAASRALTRSRKASRAASGTHTAVSSPAIAPGQLQRIAPVRLHAVSRPHRYQGWRYYFALRVQRRQLPVQHVARRTGLITEAQFFNSTQFLYQFTNGLTSIRYYSNRSHLSVLLRNGELGKM